MVYHVGYYCTDISRYIAIYHNISRYIAIYHDISRCTVSKTLKTLTNRFSLVRLFNCLPSHLRPIVLQFSTIFPILLFSIPVTCRRQFDLYLLSLSSTGYNFSSYKNFFISFIVKKRCNRRFL
jgi:hypothetical protein